MGITKLITFGAKQNCSLYQCPKMITLSVSINSFDLKCLHTNSLENIIFLQLCCISLYTDSHSYQRDVTLNQMLIIQYQVCIECVSSVYQVDMTHKRWQILAKFYYLRVFQDECSSNSLLSLLLYYDKPIIQVMHHIFYYIRHLLRSTYQFIYNGIGFLLMLSLIPKCHQQ